MVNDLLPIRKINKLASQTIFTLNKICEKRLFGASTIRNVFPWFSIKKIRPGGNSCSGKTGDSAVIFNRFSNNSSFEIVEKFEGSLFIIFIIFNISRIEFSDNCGIKSLYIFTVCINPFVISHNSRENTGGPIRVNDYSTTSEAECPTFKRGSRRNLHEAFIK